MFRTEKNL